VKVKDAEELHGSFVGSWWNDYVRVVDGWGHVQFVHANQVIAINDSTGQDITHRVLDERAQLGTQPTLVRPPRVLKAKIYRSPLSANIAQGSFFKQSGNFDEARTGALLAQVDVGNLWKVGNRQGLGFSLFGSGDDETVNAGFKVWGRRLLRRDLVIDLAPGVVLASDDDYRARDFAPAFLCETALTYNSWLSLAGQVEARDRTMDSWRPQTGETHTEWAWYLGLKLGGYAAAPAIFTSIVSVIAMQSTQAVYAPPIP